MLPVQIRLITGICKLHSNAKPTRAKSATNNVYTTLFRFALPSFIIFPVNALGITVTPNVRLLHIHV